MAELESEHGQLATPMSNVNLALQQAIADLKRYQDEREKTLCSFIQKEFELLKNEMATKGVESAQAVSQVDDAGPSSSRSPDDELNGVVHHRESIKNEFELWEDLQANVNTTGVADMYAKVLQRNQDLGSSIWHKVLEHVGFKGILPKKRPSNWLADSTEHVFVKGLSILLVLTNTAILAYETDSMIWLATNEPTKHLPAWLEMIDISFTIAFAVELLYRIFALRLWFFVCPGDWHWNLFDLILVVSSLAADLLGTMNLTFFRSFRLFRIVRVARVVRVMRFFRELRKMLLSILACIASLAWAVVFLAIIELIASIFFIQGAVLHLEHLIISDRLEEYEEAKHELLFWYESLGRTMFSLLVAVLGGVDWMEIRQPLTRLGWVYSGSFVLYIIFVFFGILNVLTGVYLTNAQDFVDRDLRIQDELVQLDNFAKDMLKLFNEIDETQCGSIEKEHFLKLMDTGQLEAYLAASGLEPLHSRLLWDLLDEAGIGQVTVAEFIIGLMRMKGNAKGIDARSLQRSLALLPSILSKSIAAEHQNKKLKAPHFSKIQL